MTPPELGAVRPGVERRGRRDLTGARRMEKLVDIAAWLRGLELQQYEQAFRNNDIDASVLPNLTADDLVAVGVTSVGRRQGRVENLRQHGANETQTHERS
jgi:hypothetical protein